MIKEIKISKIRKMILKQKKVISFFLFFILIVFWIFITSSPSIEKAKLIEIEEGQTLKETSKILKDSKLIRSPSLFNLIVVITGRDDEIVAGEYEFKEKQDLFTVIKRITTGDYDIALKKITLSEGLTTQQMANIFEREFPKFDRVLFERDTKNLEGYLFPDTYFFPENIETEIIILTLTNNFEDKIESISDILNKSPYSLEEVIIMASIIEKEATDDSRQEISNILWKRFEIGMPLQVDAGFVYERGQGTFDLSLGDLRADSPYNTYTRAGLTPTAIANPGLESIKAAANPQETDNLFFLTGNDGKMYYAETHDEHVLNKQKYLN